MTMDKLLLAVLGLIVFGAEVFMCLKFPAQVTPAMIFVQASTLLGVITKVGFGTGVAASSSPGIAAPAAATGDGAAAPTSGQTGAA